FRARYRRRQSSGLPELESVQSAFAPRPGTAVCRPHLVGDTCRSTAASRPSPAAPFAPPLTLLSYSSSSRLSLLAVIDVYISHTCPSVPWNGTGRRALPHRRFRPNGVRATSGCPTAPVPPVPHSALDRCLQF